MFFLGERKNRKKDYLKVINLFFLRPWEGFPDSEHQNSLPFFRHRVGGSDYGDPDKSFTVLNCDGIS